MFRILDNIFSEGPFNVSLKDIDCVVSGGALGPDRAAEKWSLSRLRKEAVVFPANWEKFGKAAGMIRNRDIINNSDLVIAFWDGKSKGTRNSLDMAMSSGKKIIRVLFNEQEKRIGTRPVVVNCKTYDGPDMVYVGRGSEYGNPFSSKDSGLSQYVAKDLEDAISKYETFVRTRGRKWIQGLADLRGMKLGCYCHPSPCHAKVLADLVEEFFPPIDPPESTESFEFFEL